MIVLTGLVLTGAVGTSLAHPTGAQAPRAQALDHGSDITTAGRGRIGIAVLQIGQDLRSHFGAPVDRGVLVDKVRAGGPGARAGVAAGDVVVTVDGNPVSAVADLVNAVSDRKTATPSCSV